MDTTTRTNEPRPYLARHSAKALAQGVCTRKALRGTTTSEWLPEVRCPDCGRTMPRVAFIDGREVEGAPECNERCMGAVNGGVCECRCKGRNHGGAWS